MPLYFFILPPVFLMVALMGSLRPFFIVIVVFFLPLTLMVTFLALPRPLVEAKILADWANVLPEESRALIRKL